MKKSLIFLLSIFTLLFFVSCGSTPEGTDEGQEAPSIEVVEKELSPEEEAKLLEDIDNARSKAIEAGAEELVPDDLKEADEYYASVKDDKEKLKDEAPIVIGKYDLLIDEINEINAEKAESNMLAEINDARLKALENGAEEKVPESLKKADDYFDSVKDDREKLIIEGPAVIEMYNSLIDEINEMATGEELIEKIDNARADAIAAGAEERTADDLKKADDLYNSVKDDTDKLKTECSTIVEMYDSMVEEINEQKAEESMIANIEDARNTVIVAGAEEKAVDELKVIDDLYSSVKDNREQLKEKGPEIIEEYKSLTDELNKKAAEEKLVAQLLSDIDEARNRAVEVGADVKFAEEFKKADELYESVKDDKEKIKTEGKNIADSFNSLADQIIANETLLKNIDTARENAVNAGAEEKAGEQLKNIDDYLATLKADEDLFDENGFKIPGLYNSLVDYMAAIEVKQVVDNENLSSYDESDYKTASDKLAAVEEAYGDLASAGKNVAKDAETAKKKFNTVKTVAYKKMAKDARGVAYTEKKNADSVRAAVSQKDRYKSAVENFQKGDSLYAMQNPLKAKEYYEAAEKEFNALYAEVNDKLLAAQKAIEAAKKNVQKSASYADTADEESPLTGENIYGIEDEDTVLLEADNYEDPDLAVIDVAETIEEVVEDTEEQPESETEETAAALEVTDSLLEEK